MNYERLGDYIKQVKEKNSEGIYDDLLGINIEKYFMPSVANVVGTNLSRYKVVRYNQFACNRMHVGRDAKIPLARSSRQKPFIVSPAYTVFEIIDISVLLPEYLMMWFSRPEFDRECWFHTDADVRGGLPWDLFCDIELPIPSKEKQQEIVKEYNTVVNRIKLNEQLNQKLEETAQTLYRHWFVDFEFPNEEGKPYKSSGGAMLYNEELDKEIPEGWDLISIKEFCSEMKNGGTPNRGVSEYWDSYDLPWLKTGEIENNIVIKSEEYISQLGYENSSAKLLPINTVLMAMYGATAGQIAFLKFTTTTNQACCAMICKNKESAAYLYYYLLVNQSEIANMATGGAQPNLSKNIIEDLQLLLPKDEILLIQDLSQIIDYREILTREKHTLLQIKDLLLSKMTRVEEEKTEIV